MITEYDCCVSILFNKMTEADLPQYKITVSGSLKKYFKTANLIANKHKTCPIH